MLDYVFFDRRPFDLFIAYVRAAGVEPTTCIDEETFEVSLADDLDDDLAGRIEAEYDRLLDMNRELYYAENEAGPNNFSMAGIELHLKDGTKSVVDVRPEILSKLLDALSYDELTAFVADIVRRVEDPDARTFCQRVRAGDIDFQDNDA